MGDAIIMMRGKSRNPVQSFAITAFPNKTTYMESEQLDLDGLAITATLTNGTQMVVTERCTSSPENGTTLNSTDTSVEVKWKYSGRTYTATIPITVKTFAEITWADGTDNEIISVVNAARTGKINLSEIWHVGDKRTITVASMPRVAFNTSPHAEQQVNIAITEFGGKTLEDDSECIFQWDFAESLAEIGYINNSKTNDGGYDVSARASWCDNVCFSALPAWLQSISKPFYMNTSAGGGSTVVNTTLHKLGLRTEKEILGANNQSSANEAAANAWISYYATQENRIKKLGIDGEDKEWWTASPIYSSSTQFVLIRNGGAGAYTAEGSYGIAPYGCV